jgi:hypothetical protein
MMTYEEKCVVEEKLFAYCESQSGERYKYARAFGAAWALLNEEQVRMLDRFLDEWTK